MYISQPALSKIILRLEAGVGTPLFIRKSHGVELTSEGEYLYYELRTAVPQNQQYAQPCDEACFHTKQIS